MEFLKALFDEVEGGKLGYDELKAACENAKIKLANLSTGDYVGKQKYADDINARDTRISTLEDTLATRDSDLAQVKEQLKDAGVNKEKLSSLTSQLEGLQSKYDADTKKLADDMMKQKKNYAVRDFANTKKFTSQAARRDFENYMLSKDFSLSDDGTLMGGDDFVAEYSKDNADAFVVETNDTQEAKQSANPLPQFVAPTPGNSNNSDKSFKFKFTGVRPNKGDE